MGLRIGLESLRRDSGSITPPRAGAGEETGLAMVASRETGADKQLER